MSVHSFNGTISTGNSFFSHGQVKQLKSTSSYTWTINNFCICRKRNGEVIDSPIISSGADGEHRWRMLLYPKGRNEEYRDYISVFLFLSSCKENKLDVQVKFSILNDKKEEHNERRVEQTLHRGKGIGCSDFIKRDFLIDKSNGLLPDGHLTIMYEITTGLGSPIILSSSHSNLIHELTPDEKRLADDLEQLLDDKRYSDITFICNGRQFRAHKNILSTRVPVLAKLLERNASKNMLEINDIESEVLTEVLRYAYTGRVENLIKMASSLIVAADKFQLDGLKILCEDAICKNLNVENAVDTLILADINKADKLKTQSINFIINHARDIIETPGYRLIADSDQLRLLAEVFRVLALQHH